MDTPNQTLRIAPLFNLPELNPKHATELSRSLQSMRGKWILLHFWASWCTPCLGELTEWIEFGNSFHDEPIQFIAVSTDENREDAYKILPAEKLPAHIHSLIDTTHQTSEQYGTFQFPETYLLNPELKIVTKWVGPQPWNTAPVKEFFEKLLKPEPTHSTESVRQPDPTSTGSPTNYSAPVTEEAANQEAPDPAQPQTNPNHPALHPVDLH
jgi:thiol-disulfide isomerase/thioredoxin